MDRRTFLKTAVVGSVAAGFTGTALAARYFPTQVDQSLFEAINRVKDPAKKSGLKKSHGPVITAPTTVKAGEPFTVEVAVGENLHVMGPTHWIGFIALYIGNEPAGMTDDPDIQKVLYDIAREEKTHVGEFETMLLRFDAEQVKEQEHARKEIKELTGK